MYAILLEGPELLDSNSFEGIWEPRKLILLVTQIWAGEGDGRQLWEIFQGGDVLSLDEVVVTLLSLWIFCGRGAQYPHLHRLRNGVLKMRRAVYCFWRSTGGLVVVIPVVVLLAVRNVHCYSRVSVLFSRALKHKKVSLHPSSFGEKPVPSLKLRCMLVPALSTRECIDKCSFGPSSAFTVVNAVSLLSPFP